jgi:hypothetical protein
MIRTPDLGLNFVLLMNANKSKEELERWREEFWETRTQGNPEVWMVIRQAIENTAEDAAAILWASDVSTYTGSMVLCMDRDKNPYRVPICVINEPYSYWPTAQERNAMKEKPEELNYEDIKIRTYGSTDKIYTLSNYMGIQELIKKYKEDLDIKNDVLLIYDGQIMRQDFCLFNFRLDDQMVIQAMVIPIKKDI